LISIDVGLPNFSKQRVVFLSLSTSLPPVFRSAFFLDPPAELPTMSGSSANSSSVGNGTSSGAFKALHAAADASHGQTVLGVV
jgi:hypothetical protein